MIESNVRFRRVVRSKTICHDFQHKFRRVPLGGPEYIMYNPQKCANPRLIIIVTPGNCIINVLSFMCNCLRNMYTRETDKGNARALRVSDQAFPIFELARLQTICVNETVFF